MNKQNAPIKWHDSKGNPIACTEKVKVLMENHQEMQRLLQDCFEDALLMGCDEQQFREVLTQISLNLINPYNDLDV